MSLSLSQAPSAGLALLTARQETAPAANLTDLQSEYMILQEAVRELSACLAGMHAVYSRTLTELQTSPQSDTAQSMEGKWAPGHCCESAYGPKP